MTRTLGTRLGVHGFTIIELIVVIAVISILVGVLIIGYGQWRVSAARTQVKSDLIGMQSAMEKQRLWNHEYPVYSAGETLGASGGDSIFSASKDVTLTYYTGDSKVYCINGRSTQNASVRFYIDTRSGTKNIQEGECTGSLIAGGEDEPEPEAPGSPSYNPPIAGTSWSYSDILTICESSANAPAGYTVINGASTGTVNGGSGNDIIYRPTASGLTDGSAGSDILCIGTATATVSGGGGDDIIYIKAGNATLEGSGGSDVFISLQTHAGIFDGSAGNDVFIVRPNATGIDGGAGSDTVRSETTFTGSATSVESYL